MIFYKCNGSTLCGTQADARLLDRNFVQVDIPTDKAGLMSYINDIRGLKDQDTRQSEVYENVPKCIETIVPDQNVNLTTKIDSWFEETESARPIDRILAKADYTEALRINQLSVERMVVALVENRTC